MDVNTELRRLVIPKPPLVADELAHIGAGLRFAENATNYLTSLRQEYGDTFLLDVFGYKLFCLFSPKGLESLYALPEEKASFGFATFDLLSFKTPTELFMDTDLNLFYQLLLKKQLPRYLAISNSILDMELARWRQFDELEVFDAVRSLEQRIGYGLWICQEAASDDYWLRLKAQFDVLDQEKAFVDPAQTLHTLKSNKAGEKAAIAAIRQLLSELSVGLDLENSDETLAYLHRHFAAFEGEELQRRVTHNCINTNQGFLSNLYAAIAWVLVRLLQYPEVATKIRAEIAATRQQFGPQWRSKLEALDSMRYLEQVLMESVRLSQRSITLRKVLEPVEVATESECYTVNAGVYITTLLSVKNTDSDELARFDPDHYEGNRLKSELTPGGKEQVSTFGHGKHACPAQKFSHMMCKTVVAAVLERFELELLNPQCEPSSRQIGGVARSSAPATIRLTPLWG